MANEFQAILDEVIRLRIGERTETRAITKRYDEQRAALQARCGELGHVLDFSAAISFPGEPRQRTCCVCKVQFYEEEFQPRPAEAQADAAWQGVANV